jgi:maleate isomerase
MALKDYGRRGRVGIGVPQANPTVEPEMSALLPDGVSMHVTRLNSAAPSSRDRLIEYLERLEGTLARYDTLRLDVYGFACTASSYLVGAEAERRHIEICERKAGYPIVTGAQAIGEALRHLGATRVAMGSPYPDWLTHLSHAYWRGVGVEIVTTASVDLEGSDTRAIYDVGAAAAFDKFDALTKADCECVVMTGTGLPSLPVIAALQPHVAIPIVSTNLCLAWALARRLGIEGKIGDTSFALLDGWQARLERL